LQEEPIFIFKSRTETRRVWRDKEGLGPRKLLLFLISSRTVEPRKKRKEAGGELEFEGGCNDSSEIHKKSLGFSSSSAPSQEEQHKEAVYNLIPFLGFYCSSIIVEMESRLLPAPNNPIVSR